jgi:hypothetical protein
MRVSPTFIKGLVFRPHFKAAWNASAPTPLPRPAGAPPPAPGSAEAVQAATPCPHPPQQQQQPLPAVDLDAPLPRALPVYDDVLHLDGPFMRNYFWWTAEGAATVALVRDWLATFPHAVIHYNSATAFAWKGFHEQVLGEALLAAAPMRRNPSPGPLSDPAFAGRRPAAGCLRSCARAPRPRAGRGGAVAQPPRAGASMRGGRYGGAVH